MKHTTELKIRGYHLDGYGHVNNARYLELLEEARWQYLDIINAKSYFEERNLAFVVVNINISYKYPITQGQTLRIETEPSKKGNTSWIFHQIGYLNDSSTQVIDAVVTFVLLDAKTGKPVKVNEEMQEVLLPR
ncbi:acyl-CoA thioesterase [Luteibaculum oceani]|uniref:Acyl-CoA thioesterase n=1 Tax=Luteibaculum oceani TaxID=1294296 RepID=A0A5C6UWS0_9FLAO|nr:thioesterase family protein [Luteibaculum oceani]TXC77030.1 acyl-CoA thioesterase [Luteibaculum oceani]